ncbi:MAG: NADH-quinone oxidoreductase subunit C [Bacteroidia bacterium]|nr:NADH-quinone oxidoreductase subunit C [Bacteroidia bacterium]
MEQPTNETNATTTETPVSIVNTAFEENVKAKLADAMEDIVMLDMLTVTIKHNKVYEVLQILRDEKELGFTYLTTLFGTHFPKNEHNTENLLGMTYMLHNLEKNWRIRIKTFFSIDDAQVQSVVPLFDSANWMEREAWDFYGIKFKGHPNLIRILNMEDIPFFPMRKDFPLEDPNRSDKDDSQFGR